MAPARRSEHKIQIRDQQRVWLRRVLEQVRKTPSQLAVDSGLADVTLTRFLNREDYGGVLSPLTLRAIIEHTGLPGPEAALAPQLSDMKQLDEVTPFDFARAEQENPVLANVIRKAGEQQLVAYDLHGPSLDALGYWPGDVILVDPSQSPAPRDPVIASSHGEIICRVFDPPVLTGATLRAADRPRALIVDDRAVKIIAKIVGSVRIPRPERIMSPA